MIMPVRVGAVCAAAGILAATACGSASSANAAGRPGR